MEKIRSLIGFQRLTVPRVAILGMILALMIALKYAFGFVVGVELISFCFIFLGIFLPLIDLGLLLISFNIIILVIYGFGSWWLMYWVIWPLDALISKFISKFTHNKYIFAGWGLIAGASVFFWYFVSDILFFGTNYAMLNVISAIPVNTIEGLTTMLCCLLIAPKLANVFNQFKGSFWKTEKDWKFKENKNVVLNNILLISLVIMAVTGIVLMFVFNNVFLDLKDTLITHDQGDLKGGSGYNVKE